MSPLTKSIHGIDSETWKMIVIESARDFGIEVTTNQMAQLIRFAEFLREWNKKINLTAITDPEEIAIKHFIDSMALLPFLPPETETLLDIGSGGGFPGLVLAIFRPDLQITSIDAVRKKISFQQHIIRTLSLKRVQAFHTRAESLARTNRSSIADSYNVIVSRALGSLELFVGLGLPLLAPGGTMIAYKGRSIDDEQDEFASCIVKSIPLSIDTRTYCLPKYGDRRSLVFINRNV